MENVCLSVIFSKNNQVSSLVKSYLEDIENISSVSIYSENISDFSVFKNGTLFIVDVTSEFDCDFILKLVQNVEDSKIVTLSDNYDVDTIVQVMRAGGNEFLTLPLIKSEFIDAVDRVCTIKKYTENSNCKTISIFSNKGGIGKTSIATNLALELANVTKEKVALIDLNFQTGDITTFMDLNPSFNISYLLQNINKISEDFLLEAMENYDGTSLYILAEPPLLKTSEEISSEQVNKLLNILKKHFSYIVIDAESCLDSKNIVTLTESDYIFLVTVANMPALRNAQRCLNLFDKLGFENVCILLNRYMENDDVSDKDVESVIGRKIFCKIPNNYFTIMSAINKGIPVCKFNRESNVAKCYRSLALQISDRIYRESLINKYENILGGRNGIK